MAEKKNFVSSHAEVVINENSSLKFYNSESLIIENLFTFGYNRPSDNFS